MKTFKILAGFCAVACAVLLASCSGDSALEEFGHDLDEAVLDSELYLSSYLATHSSSSSAVSSSSEADTVTSDTSSVLTDTDSASVDTAETDTLLESSSESEDELSSSAADSSASSSSEESSSSAAASSDTLSVEIPVYESYSTYTTLEAGQVYLAQVSADAGSGCLLMCGANSSAIALTVDGETYEGDYAVYATLSSPCAGETYVMQITVTANCYMAN